MKKNKNVPINKGHFDLDEKAELRIFKRILAKDGQKNMAVP